MRRDVGKLKVYDGPANEAGARDLYELHYGIPREPVAPRNAGLWFGVYFRPVDNVNAGEWFFALSDLPGHVATQFRHELTKLVTA